ncbi:MAG TPA: IclR family transcriptional regulator [Jiangellaceae bacterium]
MAGNSSEAGRSVTSKVVAILETFCHGSVHSLTEISHRTELPISTVHRLATELASLGLLERTDDSNYRAGVPLRIIGAKATHVPTVLERARFVLDDLATTTHMDVRLGVLAECGVSYLEKSACHQAMSFPTATPTMPAHATAMGKALLAFSPSRIVDVFVARGLKRYTPYTLASPDRLRRALAEIRLNGLAMSRWELQLGVSALAAPVFGPGGQVVAAIELPVRDLRSELPRLQPALVVAARGLSRQIGLAPVGRAVPVNGLQLTAATVGSAIPAQREPANGNGGASVRNPAPRAVRTQRAPASPR